MLDSITTLHWPPASSVEMISLAASNVPALQFVPNVIPDILLVMCLHVCSVIQYYPDVASVVRLQCALSANLHFTFTVITHAETVNLLCLVVRTVLMDQLVSLATMVTS